MCKEGWCIELGQVGDACGWGTVWNTLKGGATEKRWGETKILKRGGKLGQGVDGLKRVAGTPLGTMVTIKLYNQNGTSMNKCRRRSKFWSFVIT